MQKLNTETKRIKSKTKYDPLQQLENVVQKMYEKELTNQKKLTRLKKTRENEGADENAESLFDSLQIKPSSPSHIAKIKKKLQMDLRSRVVKFATASETSPTSEMKSQTMKEKISRLMSSSKSPEIRDSP